MFKSFIGATRIVASLNYFCSYRFVRISTPSHSYSTSVLWPTFIISSFLSSKQRYQSKWGNNPLIYNRFITRKWETQGGIFYLHLSWGKALSNFIAIKILKTMFPKKKLNGEFLKKTIPLESVDVQFWPSKLHLF